MRIINVLRLSRIRTAVVSQSKPVAEKKIAQPKKPGRQVEL